MRQRPKQLVASAALAYAAAITFYCPCRKINGCHKRSFLLAIAVGAGIVLHDQLS